MYVHISVHNRLIQFCNSIEDYATSLEDMVNDLEGELMELKEHTSEKARRTAAAILGAKCLTHFVNNVEPMRPTELAKLIGVSLPVISNTVAYSDDFTKDGVTREEWREWWKKAE